MAITSACNHHCGVRANAEDTVIREGHCNCPDCHDGEASRYTVAFRGDEDQARPLPLGVDGQPLRRTPMCERWYERAGDYRPWHHGTHLLQRIRDAHALNGLELGPE